MRRGRPLRATRVLEAPGFRPLAKMPKYVPSRLGAVVWVWLPRFDRERMVLAAAVLTPPVLLAALANTLMALRLSSLGFDLSDPAAAYGALVAFKTSVEVTTISLFIIFGLLAVFALHATDDAMKGMVVFSSLTLLFLAGATYGEWGFGTDPATAQLGLGIAFWGLGWVLMMVHLFALLRGTPHRRWNWVAGGVGLYQAAAFFLTLEIAIWLSLQAAAVLLVLLTAVAIVVVFDNRQRIGELWGYGLRRQVRLPERDGKGLALVAVYGIATFGLLGAEYQHHFSYRPTFTLLHFVLLAAMTPVGVMLFGALSERGGRRALLYAVPIVIGSGILIQNAFQVAWPLAVAEGIMLGSLPFLFQYLAEATKLLTRGSIFVFSMGAVGILGAAGSFVAHFAAWTDLGSDQVLLMEFAALIVAVAVAPQLPETKPQVTEEEELEDYLALARRVQTGQ